MLRIGIDIGGVCTTDNAYDADSKDELVLADGCLEVLTELKKQGHHLVIVSFCGRKRAENNRRQSLIKYFDDAFFVKKRPYKAIVCKNQGLDLLIDDRSDILARLDEHTTKVKFGVHHSDVNIKFKPDYHVHSWSDVLDVVKSIKPKKRLVEDRKELSDLVY